MTKITACSYRYKHRYVMALCHNTKVRLVKLNLLSTEIINIKAHNIQVIKDDVEIGESPEQIINQCLHEAMSSDIDISEITEVIYFGDVNLTKPALCEYPSLLRDQHQFSSLIKAYFPQCISIKRILVSGDDLIVADAEKVFAENIRRQDPDLPVVMDSFLKKGYRDFYTEIHRTDVGLVDAIVEYFRALKTSTSQNDGDYGFSKIKLLMDSLDERFDCLYDSEGYPLTFAFIHALQKDFIQLSLQYDQIAEQLFFINKSMLLSLSFSHLIPPLLRDLCLDRLKLSQNDIIFSFFGQLKHHHLGEAIDDLITGQQGFLQQHAEVSVQLTDIVKQLLEKLYRFKSSESFFGVRVQQYLYLTPKFQVVINGLIRDLEGLPLLLQDHLTNIQGIDEKLANLKQKVDIFCNEAQRKKTLSSTSFFSIEDQPVVETIRNTRSDSDAFSRQSPPSF